MLRRQGSTIVYNSTIVVTLGFIQGIVISGDGIPYELQELMQAMNIAYIPIGRSKSVDP